MLKDAKNIFYDVNILYLGKFLNIVVNKKTCCCNLKDICNEDLIFWHSR